MSTSHIVPTAHCMATLSAVQAAACMPCDGPLKTKDGIITQSALQRCLRYSLSPRTLTEVRSPSTLKPRGSPAPPSPQDGSSFLHVNSWFNQHTAWQSVGLLVADSLQDALDTSMPPPTQQQQQLSAPVVQGAAARKPGRGHARRALLAAGSGVNYVLAADNGTITPQMMARGGVGTPAPLLIYITSNVTISKPPVPQVGSMRRFECGSHQNP